MPDRPGPEHGWPRRPDSCRYHARTLCPRQSEQSLLPPPMQHTAAQAGFQRISNCWTPDRVRGNRGRTPDRVRARRRQAGDRHARPRPRLIVTGWLAQIWMSPPRPSWMLLDRLGMPATGLRWREARRTGSPCTCALHRGLPARAKFHARTPCTYSPASPASAGRPRENFHAGTPCTYSAVPPASAGRPRENFHARTPCTYSAAPPASAGRPRRCFRARTPCTNPATRPASAGRPHRNFRARTPCTYSAEPPPSAGCQAVSQESN